MSGNGPVDRMSLAKANVEAAVRLISDGWLVEVERPADGYTLTIRNGERTFTRKGIDEAVLEDEWSAARGKLILEARRALESRA